MSTIDQLKAAHAAATPGEWRVQEPDDEHSFKYVLVAPYRFIKPEGRSQREANDNAHYIALAHNQMPDLLDAVDALETLVGHVSHYGTMQHAHPDAFRDAANARAVLAKLKGTQS